MLTIATVNAGNYLGRGQEYVEKLYRGVSRNLDEFRFVCFTDDPSEYCNGVEKRALPHPFLSGWWHKLSLFQDGCFEHGERIVYFDLDTLIVRPLNEICAYDGTFAMLGPFYPHAASPYAGNQSGVMMWRAGELSAIWDAFAHDGHPNIPGGDQAYINGLDLKPDTLQEKFPDAFVSFKATDGAYPERASVVCFHGLPRPHQVRGWVKEKWI